MSAIGILSRDSTWLEESGIGFCHETDVIDKIGPCGPSTSDTPVMKRQSIPCTNPRLHVKMSRSVWRHGQVASMN